MEQRAYGVVSVAILLVSLAHGVPTFPRRSLSPGSTADTAQVSISADCMLQWLLSIGVDQSSAEAYTLNFRKERVDDRVLGNLTLEQLSQIGVSRLGHRLLIWNCLHTEAGGGCSPTVCRHGGSCYYTGAVDAFQCVCPSGVTGQICDTVVDWCTAYPCLNGGTCLTVGEGEGGTASCACPTGFIGERCEHDYCHSEPCLNGGTCVSHSEGYECSCLKGYEGTNCETVVTDVEELQEQISRLSSQVDVLDQTIGYRVDKALVDVYDTMLSAQGPRFFREFLEIDLSSITQVQYFRMDQRTYIGAVNTNSRHSHYGVIIYELLDNNTLVHIQTIADPDRPLNIAFKHFSLEGQHYLACANDFNSNSETVNSKLYKWETDRFTQVQAFGTNGAKDVDFITIKNVGSFLAFACYRDSHSLATRSRLLVWRSTVSLFVNFHTLDTTGARKIHFTSTNGNVYITVASEYNKFRHGHSNSSVYHWNGTRFVIFQHIPTYRAWDLRLFAVGCQTFLVAANFYNNSSHNTMSIVYRLENGRFVEHATLPTKGAVTIEPITIKTEYFLAVANSHDEQSAGANTASMIYKIDGPNFVPFQEIPTTKASYVHSFIMEDGCTGIAIANKVGKSKLYKWTKVSVRKTSCCV